MAATCMCPNINCRKIVTIADEARGKLVRCATCQTTFRVPTAKPGQKKSA